MKKVEGTLYKIEWFNPYTEPPDGLRVLAEFFTLKREKPAEIYEFPFTLGGGYSVGIRHVAPPGKQLSPETLARVRKQRIARRVAAKYPMFADEFIKQEIEKKPEYYAGVTDADRQIAHDNIIENEWRQYYEFLSRPEVMIVYANEPAICKEKGEKLKKEMLTIQQNAQNNKRGHA